MSIETLTALYLVGVVFLWLAFGDRVVDILVEVACDEETDELLQWE